MAKTPKKTSPSFIEQAAILAFASLFSRLLGFMYKVPVINMLGDEGFGLYNMGYTVYNFLLVISSAGLPAAISKMVSARLAVYQSGNAYRVFRVSLIVAAITGVLGSLLLFFGAGIIADFQSAPDVIYSLKVLAPTVLVVAILSVFRGYFQGMGNMAPTAMSQILEQIVNAVFSILLVYLLYRTSIPYAAAGGNAATCLGAIAGLAVIIYLYRKHRDEIHSEIAKNRVYSSKESPRDVAAELIKTAVPIIAGTAVFSLASIIDSGMAVSRLMHNGAFTYKESMAMYGQLSSKFFTITTLPVAVATSMATASIPNLAAAMAKKDSKGITEKVNMYIRLAMVVCVPAAFGIGLFADQIIALIFPNLSGNGFLLKVGSISVVFLSLNQICAGILQGLGRMKIPIAAAVFGCIGKVIANYFLIAIPSINIVGAVLGTIVCYAIASPVNMYFTYKITGAKPDFKGIILKPLICSVIMAMVCYVSYYAVYMLLPINALALIIAILIGIAFYFLSMTLAGGINRGDYMSIPMGGKILRVLEILGIHVK